MSLVMPPVDAEALARRQESAAALRTIVAEGVICDERALKAYEPEGLTAYRQPPLVVVLPETTAQVSAVLAWEPTCIA